MSLAKLKASRKTQLNKLMNEAEKLSSNRPARQKDERIWKPSTDQNGNGFAIVRFLPPTDLEEIPYQKVWSHGFKGPTGSWYIENSLQSVDMPDPVYELNGRLWNSGKESDKKQAQAQKRKLSFYSNVLVIKDSGNPENNGKVFIYQYGKKIFDKINDAWHPEFEDEEPMNPFDLWEGANFRIKISKKDGWQNYDRSAFDTPAPVADSDEEIEKIWKQTYSLKEFVDPKNYPFYKPYEELEAKLQRILNPTQARVSNVEDDDADYQSNVKEKTESPPWEDDDEADIDEILKDFSEEDED